jgi:hypothetical protein
MASLLSLTICDSEGEYVGHCPFVALIVCSIQIIQAVNISQLEGTSGHGGKIEWAEAGQENDGYAKTPHQKTLVAMEPYRGATERRALQSATWLYNHHQGLLMPKYCQGVSEVGA